MKSKKRWRVVGKRYSGKLLSACSEGMNANVANPHSIWKDVTENILAKDFNQATKVKHAIEEAQRVKAADRKSKGEEFVPQLFHLPVEGGKPELTEQAREILKSL